MRLYTCCGHLSLLCRLPSVYKQRQPIPKSGIGWRDCCTAAVYIHIYIYTSLRSGYLLETLVLKNRTQLVKKVFFDKLIYLMISPAASLARISFMASLWLRFTRPFSSISVTLTHIMSPTLQASSTFSMRLSASLEM